MTLHLKATLIYIAITLFAGGSYAQQAVMDSLEKRLAAYTGSDTGKLSVLESLIWACAFADPQKGVEYADKAIAISRAAGNYKLANLYNYQGINYQYLGKDSLAIAGFNAAVGLAEREHNLSIKASALSNLGGLYHQSSDYRKSLDMKMKALAICRELGDNKKTDVVLGNIGATYQLLGDYPQAQAFYFEALRLAQQMGDRKIEGSSLMNIGMVFKKAGNYTKAFLYYDSALVIYQGINNLQGSAWIYSAMAAAYDDIDSTDKALYLYHQALDINRKIKDKRGEIEAIADIGIVYSGRKEYTAAFRFLTDALKLMEGVSYDYVKSTVFNELAVVVMEAGEGELRAMAVIPARQYAEAEQYALKALALSRQIESQHNEMATLYTLSTIHQKQQKWALAMDEFKKYIALKDSLFNEQKGIEIATREIQFEAGKKQALAEEALGTEKQIRNYILAGLLLLLTGAVGIFFFYKKYRDGLQQQRELLHKARAADTEMKVLRLQMNPHFIFNSLNSISNYIRQKDVETADYYLSKFARLMRGILEHAEEREVALADELKMLELYIKLESSRLNNKLNYEIIVAADVDAETTLIPPMILQPFVENSIWHGIAAKEGEGMIAIRVNKKGEMLCCIVEDNGVGRKDTQEAARKSYGINITRERIALLRGAKHADAGVVLTDLAQGTRIEIKLPFETTV